VGRRVPAPAFSHDRRRDPPSPRLRRGKRVAPSRSVQHGEFESWRADLRVRRAHPFPLHPALLPGPFRSIERTRKSRITRTMRQAGDQRGPPRSPPLRHSSFGLRHWSLVIPPLAVASLWIQEKEKDPAGERSHSADASGIRIFSRAPACPAHHSSPREPALAFRRDPSPFWLAAGT
jgi:hypothetical protein